MRTAGARSAIHAIIDEGSAYFVMWHYSLPLPVRKRGETGMKMQFAVAVLMLPILVATGCVDEKGGGASVEKPPKERDVIVETLAGPPAAYGAANVPFYSKVTFKAKKLGTDKDLVCLQVVLGGSVSLACPGMQTMPLSVPLPEEPKP